jgi:hypothetical protein
LEMGYDVNTPIMEIYNISEWKITYKKEIQNNMEWKEETPHR